jgi:ABC-type transporter Mla subunit MlaD
VSGDRSAYVRVGLLVVGGVVLVLGLLWFFGGGEFRGGVVYESYFRESVQGLEVGAPVKYRGVGIGRVTEIGLVSAAYGEGAPDEKVDQSFYRLVYVRFVVDTKRLGAGVPLSESIKLGLRVRLATQGITGLTYVEADFVDPSQYPALRVPWTPRYQYVPSMPSTLQQVQNVATQFLTKMNRVDIDALSRSLNELVNDLRTSVGSGDLHQTLTHATKLMQTLDETVRAADLPGLSADLRQTSGAIRALANDPDLHKSLANAAVLSERLATASARLEPLLTRLQTTLRRVDSGTADVQAALGPILSDVRATVANLRDASESLRRYPAQLLLGGPPPRPAGQAQ